MKKIVKTLETAASVFKILTNIFDIYISSYMVWSKQKLSYTDYCVVVKKNKAKCTFENLFNIFFIRKYVSLVIATA